MDSPPAMFIVNQSSWSATEPVTVANKSCLIQLLIVEEVIIRRQGSLKAFKLGLDHLHLTQLIEAYPAVIKPLFVYQLEPLTSEVFWSLVASSRPSEDALKQSAYDMFKEFVIYVGG